jgi:hypothetical protein
MTRQRACVVWGRGCAPSRILTQTLLALNSHFDAQVGLLLLEI